MVSTSSPTESSSTLGAATSGDLPTCLIERSDASAVKNHCTRMLDVVSDVLAKSPPLIGLATPAIWAAGLAMVNSSQFGCSNVANRLYPPEQRRSRKLVLENNFDSYAPPTDANTRRRRTLHRTGH
jgi:hypothetical protein